MEGITYTWFNEDKSILLCTYPENEWTWNDFHAAFHVQNEMIDSVSHPKVHVIVDTRTSRWLPKGGSLLSGIRKLTSLKHPRQGHTVIVGAKGMVATIARIVTNMMGEQKQEIHLVDSMEEAEQIIANLNHEVA